MKRDRNIVLTGLAAVIFTAAIYTLFMAGQFNKPMDVALMPSGHSDMVGERGFLMLFIMWAVVQVAMMSPTAGPHPKWQERPLALVVSNPNSPTLPSKESPCDLLRQSFTKWQLSNDFVFVREIPKTSVGKFDKKVIRHSKRTIVCLIDEFSAGQSIWDTYNSPALNTGLRGLALMKQCSFLIHLKNRVR